MRGRCNRLVGKFLTSAIFTPRSPTEAFARGWRASTQLRPTPEIGLKRGFS